VDVLELRDLCVEFETDAGKLPAVRGVDLRVERGETVALVGESGCGKSVTALATMRLLGSTGRIAQGEIRFEGRDLVELPEEEVRALRGGRIGMVFQEPMTSLNPVFRIGDQVAEVLATHQGLEKGERRREATRLLDKVGIPAAATRVDQYPHELSGGMKQRAMIAMAIACEPDLLIVDGLQREMGMAILLITHNLGVVAQYATRVYVMYAGKIAESADVETLFHAPLHPYTRALLRALPARGRRGERLASIEGNVPAPLEYPAGCAFCTRCPEVRPRCAGEQPPLEEHAPGHAAACFYAGGSGA
jgi:oligopeptide/dipeptide ABC transporter ATP-binding protein